MGLSKPSSAYMFLFSHARAVVSAAVRANVLGPYSAQSELARPELRTKIEELVNRFWEVPPEDAGQRVPVVDLWMGRHEKLYSRIFNS
jgi:urease accessory protein